MTRTSNITGWGGLRRFGAYAAISLIPVVWLGFLLVHTVRSESDRSALREGEAQATAIASSAVQPFLGGHPLGTGLTLNERLRITNTARSLLAQRAVLVFRIRDNDGRVMFDARTPTADPGPPIIDHEVQEAVDEGVVSLLTHVGADEVDGSAPEGEPAIEAYVALHAGPDERVVGVVELYLPYTPIAEARQASIDRLILTIVLGLAMLWLALGGIVYSIGVRLRRHHAEAEQMALHDRLTGLPGRALYADRVTSALAAGGRTGTDVAIVVLDLDRFKEVNDTLGHRNGDELLKLVTARLHDALRPGDTVARLGGDEFGIVLPGARATTVEQILRRIQDSLAHEAELGGVAVSIDASMGYAMWPDDGDTEEMLQQRAELALYAAKSARAAIVRYHPGIDEFDPQRLGLIAELRRAINGGELVLHYQPKLDANSGGVVAFEALVRWHHPTRGLVMPGDFIPIAESTGLIVPLTHWVLDHALAQLAEWSKVHPWLQMAVNISARNLRDELPGLVLNRLAAHGVSASQLTLEITETSFAADPVRATALLEELHAAGVKVSLDDFGQGYTSLGSLGHLPVSELKIDSGFVLSMGASTQDRAIVASVIELGHHLGLTVVAEGVETEAVRDDLRRLRCDLMQGYLFSPPVTPERALELVDTLSAV